jgi:ABC-type uncharacterized transport system permease subunit
MKKFVLPLLGLFVGLTLGLLLSFLAGENPWQVFKIIVNSAFGSRYDLGVTLYYATPLVFTGLSVAVAFHAGLFNIGAEGQLNLAALAAAIVGVSFPNLPFPLAPILAMLAAFFVGALWGWIPGWLRTRRGSHEVINTIMMNFLAAALVNWIVTSFQNPESQSPETKPIAPAYFLRSLDPVAAWFGDAPVSFAVIVAVILAFLLWAFLWHTPWGYEIRAAGENEHAARVAGIDVARARQRAMALAGIFAAFLALSEILAGAGRFRIGFSPDFGFVGIAVALLAQNHPIAILFSALLFGALHKGAADLDIETDYVTRDLSLVIQALVILCVSAASALQWKRSSR